MHLPWQANSSQQIQLTSDSSSLQSGKRPCSKSRKTGGWIVCFPTAIRDQIARAGQIIRARRAEPTFEQIKNRAGGRSRSTRNVLFPLSSSWADKRSAKKDASLDNVVCRSNNESFPEMIVGTHAIEFSDGHRGNWENEKHLYEETEC